MSAKSISNQFGFFLIFTFVLSFTKAANVFGYADNLSLVAVPTVSARQIIYSRFPVSPSIDGTIWAINPDGTGDHQITTGSYPRLSPDGNYLAFKRKDSTNDPNYNNVLLIICSIQICF